MNSLKNKISRRVFLELSCLALVAAACGKTIPLIEIPTPTSTSVPPTRTERKPTETRTPSPSTTPTKTTTPNPTQTQAPQPTKTEAIPSYEELIRNARIQDFWVETIDSNDYSDVAYPIYVGGGGVELTRNINGEQVTIIAIKTIIPDIRDSDTIREMWIPLRYVLPDGTVTDMVQIVDGREEGGEFISVEEVINRLEIGDQMMIDYFENINASNREICIQNATCRMVLGVYDIYNAGELLNPLLGEEGNEWPEDFILPAWTLWVNTDNKLSNNN